ncbi:HDIG domain-containing metalloprotein [Isachenkonia alkalipeptolytica]|uniref:HD domain-containing protein n=1 Tax=Isachenkonia alkalipeptolytica TaxID=2565777 RepID=A0AA43XMR1_9CLOT|nr:HDIG domain-containing metalloprotein [Isachenkonia alkalipeptolytica]NBG89079.1 HD domain-containing protein [Isachenkonia alkalipeptolytica]
MDRIINTIAGKAKERGESCYLVGGTLRDLLLNRDLLIQDLDFVTEKDPKDFVESLLTVLEGKLIPIDKGNRLYRVRLPDGLILDFTQREGESIEEDLKKRDFTISAMAYPMDAPWPMEKEYIIDPFKGQQDIEKRRIRHIREEAFVEDPLRLIRAPRLMCQLRFNMGEETIKVIRKHAHRLTEVAGERITQELFLILQQDKTYHFLTFMDKKLNILNKIFPEIEEMRDIGECKYHVVDSWTHSVYTVKVAESVIYAQGYFEDHIREAYEEHAREKISGNHRRIDLIKLGALFHDIGKPSAKKVDPTGRTRFRGHEITGAELVKEYGERLKWSKREIALLYKYVAQHMIPLVLYKKNDVSGKALYQFFSEAGKETLDLLLIALADIVSTRKLLDPHEEMGMFKIHVEYIANNYITRYRPIENITNIITGREVMEAVNLPESTFVGEVLEDLKKAMFYGQVPQHKEGALKYLRKHYPLKDSGKKTIREP